VPVIYSARYVLPIATPPIEDGAIAIDGSTIAAVGSRAEILAQFPNALAQDFDEAAIIPGLVNTHSHLELTVMRGFLEAEENDFFAWLRKLTVARMAMDEEDLLVSAKCGAIEAARAGITFLGDSSSFATQSMRALNAVGLRAIVYQESFGPDPKLAAENVAKLRVQLSGMRDLETGLIRAGVSPHAPYTVSAPQLELISRLAIEEKLPLMMHAAESESERLFMIEGRGPFADGLKQRNIEWQAPRVSTIQYLDRHRVLETRPLLAHCINVDDGDLDLIRKNGTGIAHCPKSNAKLRHGRAPFAEFIAQGINVGLGSDSVASNNTCDMLEEARFAALLARTAHTSGTNSTEVSAADALFAATLGGARALGLDQQVGALKAGMQADIAIIDLGGAHQGPVRSAADAVIFSSSGRDVRLTMVAGKEVYRDGCVNGLDELEMQDRLEGIRSKLDRTN